MSRAAELVSRFEKRHPLAVRLAEAVSLAVLVDPLLLRRARRLFVPQADAGTEADLWLSPLVRTRSPDGIVFPPEVAEELRQRLQESGRLEEVWKMNKELHGHLPPALQLEEEIAWLSVSKDSGTADRIEELLQSALAALVAGERRGLAYWAARAMSALPSKVREKSEAAAMLEVGAHLRLNGNASPARSHEGLPDWLSWVAPADLPYVRVRLRLFHGAVEIDSASTDEGNLLHVPETAPLLIDLMWEEPEEEEKRSVQVTLRKGEVVTVPVEAREVRLRTLLGNIYILRPTVGFSTYKSMVPPRQPFVYRDDYDRVIEALVAASQGGRAGTVGLTTALHGIGGIGKTALATEVCWDERVRRAYPDGILWTTMGEDVDSDGRLARLRNLMRWWTGEEPPPFETVAAAGVMLCELLAGKRVLLVVDDVWRPEDVEPFRVLDPGSALLMTTRDRRTLPLNSIAIEVDDMTSTEAGTLLGAGLPGSNTTSLSALAARLGKWPLLLNIVNRQLRELIDDGLTLEQALREVEEALQAEGLTAFDAADSESRASSVARVLGLSLARLSPEERDRFGELAIFPEDIDVPLSILWRLWHLGDFEVLKFCGRLHDMSLLLRFDRVASTIRLHDVVRAYLLRRGGDLAPVHRRLLTASRPTSGRWQDLPREETYLWGNLIYHLAGSGEIETCRELLLDFAYLQAKLEATDIDALLADFAGFAEDQELAAVAEALRSSADILAKDQKQLPLQLLNRLQDQELPGIRRLLHEIRADHEARLRPNQEIFIPLERTLIRSFEGHKAGVNSVAMVDGRRALSASEDGTLRLWDLESGQLLTTMEGHSGGVRSVAVVDSRRVVSASEDRTLRLWDLESGKLLRAMEGHSGGVRSVAVADGRRMVSASEDRTLRLWDLERGMLLSTLKGHSGGVRSVAVVDSRRVVSASEDRTLRLWDLESGKLLRTLEGHSGEVRSVAMVDSRRAVSASEDRILRLWDLESGVLLQTLEGHSGGVNAVAVMDSRRIVSGSEDKTLRSWDLESGQTSTITMMDAPLISMAASHEKALLVGDELGSLLYLDMTQLSYADLRSTSVG